MEEEKKYLRRIVDEQVDHYLKIAGCIILEGPRWCGKTWTGIKHSKSAASLLDRETFDMGSLSPKLVFEGEKPRLIDEWQLLPSLWDPLRHDIDLSGEKGRYILAGSFRPDKEETVHGGPGRFVKVKMHPMSLYESGDSSGAVSFKDLFENGVKETSTGEVDARKLAYLITRGGWPGNLGVEEEDAGILPLNYFRFLLENDLPRVEPSLSGKRTPETLARSLARNESTTAKVSLLERDCGLDPDSAMSRPTLEKILSAFEKLYFTSDTPAFSLNLRSSLRLKQSPKRHLCDPSISAAILGVNAEGLLRDLPLFGFLFEAMAERDLQIYAEAMGGTLYHYQDYKSREIDAVVQLQNQDWIAFEIKLGTKEIEEAAKNLIKIRDDIVREGGRAPKGLYVISGLSSYAYTLPSGVGVIPLTALRD